MTTFSIANGDATTFTDTTANTGITIDFASLDNSLSVQINGVDLFVGGPAGAPNELQFQVSGTSGQTVQFADGDLYEANTPAIWQLGNTNGEPIFSLTINPDGTISMSGVKANNGTLEPLQTFNGLTVNTAAIAAAWNDTGDNIISIDQIVTGPTNASGAFVDVLCFASGTLIETAQGPKPVETLKTDDQILTIDGAFKPIRWIGSMQLSADRLRVQNRLKPILIRADALGPGFPKTDLIVSPQHRILVSSVIAMRMFGTSEVLIPAKKLLPLPGVEVVADGVNGVEYWHILFDEHEVIWSNGTPSESLYTGPEALNALSASSKAEIEALFPEICAPDFAPTCARAMPDTGQMVGKLLARHQKNNRALVTLQARQP